MYADSYQRYGTPLEPLEEDAVPSKKPVYVQDQIVTDENGKRRFHGAFTGGFSAGFWNTVGSLEGWKPQTFKSSRNEKAPQREEQRPEDFMDDEDMGDFGIAPQRIQTTEEFSININEGRKRKLQQPSTGPIPGTPVLEELLRPVKDNVAIRMLKHMGWRPGQGIGPRVTRKEKKKAKERNKREMYIQERYGCQSNDGESVSCEPNINADNSDQDTGSSSEEDDEITFAPDDFELCNYKVKKDLFGLGYTGLSRDPVLSQNPGTSTTEHINFFENLEIGDRSNRKIPISGQAFGVGAFEEEDDDIYARDDLSKYDFTLENKKKPKKKPVKHVQDPNVLEGFVAASTKFEFPPPYTVELPPGYKPRNWALRKTRFAPLDPERAKEIRLSTADIFEPSQRGQMLGEQLDEAPSTSAKAQLLMEKQKAFTPEMPETYKSQILGEQLGEGPGTSANAQLLKEKPKSYMKDMQQMYKSREEKTKELLERISARSRNFTQGGIITAEGEEKSKPTATSTEAAGQREREDLLEKARSKTQNIATVPLSGNFKPFLGDDGKQRRYEQFLTENLRSEEEARTFLRTIQPVNLSAWDREMEMKEFMQARNLYKPLEGSMSDRFITESSVATEKAVVEIEKEKDKKIVVVRTKTMWKPAALLCKRYNIAEPFGGTMVEEKRRTRSRLSVFDYIECSVNAKDTFQTPVIIPKHIEAPKPIRREAVFHAKEDTKAAEKPIELVKLEPEVSKKPAEFVPIIRQETVPTQENVVSTPTSASIQPKPYVPKTDLEKRVMECMKMPLLERTEIYKAIFADSSSEEEEKEIVDKKPELEHDGTTKNPTSGDFITSAVSKPLSAAAANLLRNNSPPRGIFAALFTPNEQTIADSEKTTKPTNDDVKPTKDDVKPTNDDVKPTNTDPVTSTKITNAKTPMDITTGIVPRVLFTPRSAHLTKKEKTIEDEANVYGPRVPDHIGQSTTTAKKEKTDSQIDNKLLKLLQNQRSAKHKGVVVEEEWVEKTGDDNSSSADSESSTDEKHKKKSKKSKKKSSKEHDRKQKKHAKKSKKYEKSHKHKKTKKH